jgi:hypothetical protein
MKYEDFYTHLTLQVKNLALIGPSISIKLDDNKISMSKLKVPLLFSRFIIFPIKIYGETLRHLNILILDNKTKIVERYEPFNQYLNNSQINDLLEPLLYKLMSMSKIYFLKFETTLNTETVFNNTNCGLYCVKYVVDKIKKLN